MEIRGLQSSEIAEVAQFIAQGYDDDPFFHWCVANDPRQNQFVARYYEIYLGATGSICNLVRDDDGQLIAATIWLPHDVDPSIYDQIDRVTEQHERQFRLVADQSHANEPAGVPFYQLVGVVVAKQMQGQGIATALLQYQLAKFDTANLPTYLEASTQFTGSGLYGNLGYEPFGQVMNFENQAYLYPLFRVAQP